MFYFILENEEDIFFISSASEKIISRLAESTSCRLCGERFREPRPKRKMRFHVEKSYWRVFCKCGRDFSRHETLHTHWDSVATSSNVSKTYIKNKIFYILFQIFIKPAFYLSD
jgi:hypothetical protein